MLNSVIQIDNHRLTVKSTIAEGGFGYVYEVHDNESNAIYALKKINSTDKESQIEIENEINILSTLQPNPHIMKFFSSTKVNNNPNQDASDNNNFKFSYFILCEYCDRGTLTDLELPSTELERSCRILYQLSLALKHMHGLKIIHRDIKAENILFDSTGRVKLCDFGSSTKESYEPNLNWTTLQRSMVEEEMQRHTTPLYRPPEILDTYYHYPINCAIDIWALGCLTYFVRFGQHAFPDSGKLQIINCCYSIPKDVSENDPLVSIIRQCLKADPNERISIEAIVSSLEVEFNESMDLEGDIVPFTPFKKQQIEQSQQKPVQQSPKQQTQSKHPQKSTGQQVTIEQTLSNKQHDERVDISEIHIKDGQVTDTLIELGNTPSSKKDNNNDNSNSNEDDPAKKAGLPIELMAPTQEREKVDIDKLIEMDSVISDQKVLSPKKATTTSVTNNSGGPNKKHAFDDLLESFGTTLPSNGSSSTLQQLSNDVYGDFGIDPKLRILEWKESRRGNIRALLSSLHQVLSEEFRWKQIGMHQLVTDSDVKKIYRLACLAIHPDKVSGCDSETREIANMIFMELNDAWAKFEGK